MPKAPVIRRVRRTDKRPTYRAKKSARITVNGVGFDCLPWEPSPRITIPYAMKRYAAGATLVELAERYQVSKTTMEKMLWACGLRRKRGGVHGSGKRRSDGNRNN